MTECRKDDIICYVLVRPEHMERYRSGHNEAVLKTVCPQGHMGSNPILSAGQQPIDRELIVKRIRKNSFSNVELNIARVRAALEKYPSWPKGHPWKGCRSLIAARGFKSLLLRLLENKVKKLLTNNNECAIMIWLSQKATKNKSVQKRIEKNKKSS